MARRQKAKNKNDSARRLLENLGAADTATHGFTGMIKPAKLGDNSIMFALVGDCSKWIKIPLSQVKDLKDLHLVRCRGHSYRLVHVFMKKPESPEGKTFAAMAHLQSASAPAPGSTNLCWNGKSWVPCPK